VGPIISRNDGKPFSKSQFFGFIDRSVMVPKKQHSCGRVDSELFGIADKQSGTLSHRAVCDIFRQLVAICSFVGGSFWFS
jgi:hypothetical protein